MEAERSMDADRVVGVLERIVRGDYRRPEFGRCDNGPEMTSHALRDWCRFSRTGAAFIEPGSPWENPFVESFNSRVRDELLAVEIFSCLTEAKVMVEDFRVGYSANRPHRANRLISRTGSSTSSPDSLKRLRRPRGRQGRPSGCHAEGREFESLQPLDQKAPQM